MGHDRHQMRPVDTWLAAEHRSDDTAADAALRTLIRELPTTAPPVGFASRVMAAAARDGIVRTPPRRGWSAAQSAERVARRVALEPVKAGVVGFLAQLLFVPLLVTGIILLVVTIIGIPLLVLVPVVLVGVLVVMVLGFTGVAQGVGQRLGGGVGQGHRSAFVLFWLGLALVMTPTLFGEALGLMPGPVGFFAVMLGIIGFVVEYVAWTTGLGAVILNRFGGEPAAVAGAPPPPIPEPPAGTPPPPPDLPLTEPPPSASDGRV